MRNHQPTFGDPILRLQRRIDALEAEVASLRGQKRPSVPIYSVQDLIDLTMNDGETWINGSDDTLYFQSSGITRTVTSNP